MAMKDLIKILQDSGHSLVVAKGDVCTFDGRGVSDLFRLLEENPALLHGASVADKVVGKAAASLMALAKVKDVHATVISQPALDLLRSNGIHVMYEKAVPHIINRAGTGLCPLEARCMKCLTPEECFVVIRAFMEEMKATELKE